MKLVKLLLCGSVALATVNPTNAQQSPTPPSVGGVEAGTAAVAPLDARAQRKAEGAERKRRAALVREYGAGPYPDEIDAYLASKPETLRPLFRTLFTGGERNAVLNFQRVGLAAMELGDWTEAENAFDGALARIEAIYAKNKLAQAARSLFHNESNKDFKGEPYERSMAYFYRGLLYLRAGDYDNARATFKAGEYQDTVSEAEEFKGDFAALQYLTGWTYHCQGDHNSANEAFDLAAASQAGLTRPGADRRLLLIGELGAGPVKARSGTQSEKLIFEAGPQQPMDDVSFTLNGGAQIRPILATSVQYQATTRGGRAIDGILAGKAEFKNTTGAIAEAATTMSMMQLAGGNADAAGGFAAAGMLFSLFASTAKTLADIRGWDTLPDNIMIGTATLPDAPLAIKAQYRNRSSGVSFVREATMQSRAGTCGIAWSRAQSSAGIAAAIPGEDAGVANRVARKKDVQIKNKAFREALMASNSAPAQLANKGGLQ